MKRKLSRLCVSPVRLACVADAVVVVVTRRDGSLSLVTFAVTFLTTSAAHSAQVTCVLYRQLFLYLPATLNFFPGRE